MTGAYTDLLAKCEAQGIRLALAGDGGLAIDAPRDALTPELIERLRGHKGEILAAMTTRARSGGDKTPAITGKKGVLVSSPLSPVVKSEIAGDGWPDPCPQCGSLEAWEDCCRSPRWHCMTCDPPTVALRILALAQRCRAQRTTITPAERREPPRPLCITPPETER